MDAGARVLYSSILPTCHLKRPWLNRNAQHILFGWEKETECDGPALVISFARLVVEFTHTWNALCHAFHSAVSMCKGDFSILKRGVEKGQLIIMTVSCRKKSSIYRRQHASEYQVIPMNMWGQQIHDLFESFQGHLAHNC